MRGFCLGTVAALLCGAGLVVWANAAVVCGCVDFENLEYCCTDNRNCACVNGYCTDENKTCYSLPTIWWDDPGYEIVCEQWPCYSSMDGCMVEPVNPYCDNWYYMCRYVGQVHYYGNVSRCHNGDPCGPGPVEPPHVNP